MEPDREQDQSKVNRQKVESQAEAWGWPVPSVAELQGMDLSQVEALLSIVRCEEHAETKKVLSSDEAFVTRELQGRVRGLMGFRKKLESAVKSLH